MKRRIDLVNLAQHGVRTEGGCLVWPFARSAAGYGQVYANGRVRYVHRLVLARKLGRRLMGHEHACHRCDTPACFDEAHLFLGSNHDNRLDSVQKGRTSRGAHRPNAKLSADTVRVIRESAKAGETHAFLSSLFGVGRQTVTGIVSRRCWNWLPDFPVRVVDRARSTGREDA